MSVEKRTRPYLLDFSRELFFLRKKMGFSQIELESLIELKLEDLIKEGSSIKTTPVGMVKIISLWESGIRKRPDQGKLEIVKIVDSILEGKGVLTRLYSDALNLYHNHKTSCEQYIVQTPLEIIGDTRNRKRKILIRLHRIIPESIIDYPEVDKLINCLVAFFLESDLDVSLISENTIKLLADELILDKDSACK